MSARSGLDQKSRPSAQPTLSSFFQPPLPLPSFIVMGVSAEPGQKGVNWSNIAVGEFP